MISVWLYDRVKIDRIPKTELIKIKHLNLPINSNPTLIQNSIHNSTTQKPHQKNTQKSMNIQIRMRERERLPSIWSLGERQCQSIASGWFYWPSSPRSCSHSSPFCDQQERNHEKWNIKLSLFLSNSIC